MNTNQKVKALTFGELISCGCRTCGKRRASGAIELALKARQGEIGPFNFRNYQQPQETTL
jgi:hypothetical protein